MTDIKIFLAEDNEHDQFHVENSFSEAGKRDVLSVFEDGSDLVVALGSVLPDCILLDMGMPRLDGFGVLEFLRSNQLSSLKVFILSSSDYHEEILQEKGAQPTAFLRKPVSYDDVIKALADNA